jgi:hypothetical protein
MVAKNIQKVGQGIEKEEVQDAMIQHIEGELMAKEDKRIGKFIFIVRRNRARR